ncbi:lanthionine synthetase C family protein [Kitasatospora sp. NPDC057541]|uniref:lanthionine synthetase C family protein n=1 Tax=unclassified Kitasatospora TaxID=2633591 RepID=UPI0036CF0932
MSLARTLYEDALEGAAGTDDLSLQLDVTLARLEFSRVTGEDQGAIGAFRDALGLLRVGHGATPWLYGGAAHVGWTAVQLSRVHGVALGGLTAIDDTVVRWVEEYPEDVDVDLPTGVLGLGVYGLVHPSRSTREKITSGVMDVIEARTERGDGAFIRLAPARFRLAETPHLVGYRDLGMAHGNAGLVSFLASVAMSDTPARERARKLLDETLAWLLKQRTDTDGAVFPQAVELRYEISRSAWCYGDPGIALALDVATKATGDPEVAEVAQHVAATAAVRPVDRTRVVDPCLCHGAAGLIYFANRVRGDHGLPAADVVIDFWTSFVQRRRARGGLEYYGREGMRPEHSFLEGDLGVALTLLHLASGVPPLWEERLLTIPIGSGRTE